MKNSIFLILVLNTLLAYSQIVLPINFEEGQVVTENFVDFNGGTATVVDNPFPSDENPSSVVGKIVRDGGDVWAGSYLTVPPIDFTTETTINMRVYSVFPGLLVKFKLEGDGVATEKDAITTGTNEWEILTWSFSGEASEIYNKLVLMFDFGNTGNGTESSTFYFDDIFQSDPTGGLAQIDLPITYDDSSVYYSLIPFGDEEGTTDIIYNPDTNNSLVYVTKSGSAATWAGVSVSNESGLENNIPVTSSNSKMYVHTYVTGSSNTGIPVRLKIENKNDPTQSVETEAFTTITDGWEILEFDFNNEATGTAALNESYPFNMASLFFNFGSAGDNQTVYYFDNISFGSPISLSTESFSTDSFKLYPNPVENYLNIKAVARVVKNIDIYNILGKKVYSSGPASKIDMKSYSEGIYFVKINNITYKIIKN
jgi:hypothetical protein